MMVTDSTCLVGGYEGTNLHLELRLGNGSGDMMGWQSVTQMGLGLQKTPSHGYCDWTLSRQFGQAEKCTE
jgi:hypothetical protein